MTTKLNFKQSFNAGLKAAGTATLIIAYFGLSVPVFSVAWVPLKR
jgi:hypothetical protein